MKEFNQDLENLLNAYDSNWDDYLALRKQFIAKYSLSVDKLEDHLLPYSKEMVQKIRDEKMQLVTTDEFVKLHKESLTAIRENDKFQERLNTAKKALSEIAEFDCCDDCYSTAYEALMEIDEEFQKNISKANKFIEEAKKRLEGSDDE